MKLIFWGLILILFDINLYLGSSIISFIPDFVGYALLFKGMEKEDECDTWQRARPQVKAAAVLSGIIWVLNCVGVGALSWLSLVLPLILAALQLFVSYKVTKGIRELEKEHGWDLYGRSLSSAWMVVALWVVLEQLMTWVGLSPMVMLAMIAAVIFKIYYQFRFHKSRRAYEEYEACREE